MAMVPVPSSGTRKSHAFVDGERNGHRFGEFREIEMPEYPPSPKGEELRKLRLQIPYSLRQAAAVLKVGVVQLSGLERGTITYTTNEEWDRVYAILRGLIIPKP